MLNIYVLTTIIVILAFGFDFINGFHDSANAIATSVTTRVLTMTEAIIMSASLNFIGAFTGTKVAQTIGDGIVGTNYVIPQVVAGALIAAIIWDIITWYFGIPSSSSHALVGGLMGAAITEYAIVHHFVALDIVNWTKFVDKVVVPLFMSPILGFIMGYIFMSIMNFFLKNTRPAAVTRVFSKAQIVSAALMAFSHGGNDAQKSMGIITLALMSAGFLKAFNVPIWVKIGCATAMAFGTAAGGKKIIKTVGSKMARLAPVNGFAAETGAAAVIFTATLLQAPVSTTHIISTSIMGVGASKRMSSVRWGVAKSIVWAWVITIPASAIFACLVMLLFKLIHIV